MAKYEFTVTVSPRFLPEQSDPDSDKYLFAYTIRIVNSGQTTAQLMTGFLRVVCVPRCHGLQRSRFCG